MSRPTSPQRAFSKPAAAGSYVTAAVAAALGLSMLPSGAQAQAAPTPALLDPVLLGQYTPLERQLATAALDVLTYNNSNSTVCPDGSGTCPGTVYNLVNYDIAGLTATAEELLELGQGEGGYHVADAAGLDDILRWFGPEELFEMGSLSTGFANGQLGTLNDRISAIRSVSRARLFARNVVSAALKNGYASNNGVPAGSAGDSFSRLNLFVNATAGFGKRSDTTGSFGGSGTGSEDAFDFNNNEAQLGIDWRFSDKLVTGGMLGYTKRKVDFNPDESAADGKIDADGFSLLAFTQWDDLHWYGSAAVGFQKLNMDSLRRISVLATSGDSITAPDTAAKGSADSSGLLASVNLGLPFQWGAWGTDLYLNAAWQKQSIDGFSEQPVDGGSGPPTGFLFKVGKQDIKSFDTAVGVKVQYVATPAFGVIVPFLRGEFHQELEDSARKLALEFEGLDGLDVSALSASELAELHDAYRFNLSSDRPDKSYVTAAVGVSAVLGGSSRVNAAGRGGGGVQCYVQYSTAFGLAHYDSSTIAAGLRYEF